MANTAFRFDLPDSTPRYHLESAIRLIADGRRPLPMGISRTIGKKGIVLALNRKAFRVTRELLEISGLPSLKVARPRLPAGWQITGLVVRVLPHSLSLELRARKPPQKRKKSKHAVPRGTGERLHAPAAMFFVAGVRPRTVNGGLPSLGKRAK
jgi:hypothetical protein